MDEGADARQEQPPYRPVLPANLRVPGKAKKLQPRPATSKALA